MMQHLPQQLSLNFGDEVQSSRPSETVSPDRGDAGTHSTKATATKAVLQNATVLSFLGAKEAREQKRITDIYRGILASVSHIA